MVQLGSIGLLHPGEMGAAIGGVLAREHPVWCGILGPKSGIRPSGGGCGAHRCRLDRSHPRRMCAHHLDLPTRGGP